MKQPVLIPIGSRGHVSLIRLAASLNIDTQDRQDKQDEKLVHKKLTGSMIECAFVENLRVLRGPSRTPFESFPTPWNPFADSSFALLTDPLSPLVEIFSPFPTFGGSLLSFLQPLSGPSSSFVALRGFLFFGLGGYLFVLRGPSWIESRPGEKCGPSMPSGGQGVPLRRVCLPENCIHYWAGGGAAAGVLGVVWERLNRLMMSVVMSTEVVLYRTWLFWLDESRIR